MKNSKHFLQVMNKFDATIPLEQEATVDWAYVEAIGLAMSMVPLVDDSVYFGEIRTPSGDLEGTFHCTSRESRWFPHSTREEAADLLVKEML